ncbi:DUF4405 domain-containing protein [Fusicatenibacter saccharivorans]|uniref:DUF4405 domain-containing protein n=1 Tax=Fusicatenibacter saccharivorans TaxID=1150298 RepID=UPI003F8A4269
MQSKMIGKIIVDLGMTVLLMLLMAFELIGRTAHEWIGAGMFVLFILHHILNLKWSKNLFHGKYSAYRFLQTISAGLVFLTMLGSMVSAVLISREVFAFLPISGGRSFGRTLHMFCAYWGFLFLSFHLGIHWNMILRMTGKLSRKKSKLRVWFLRLTGFLIAAYGVYALFHREIPSYLFLQTQFVFFDFEEPLVFFLLDYLTVMGLFVFSGHYAGQAVRRLSKSRKRAKS